MSVANPEYESEYDNKCGDGENSPGKFARRFECQVFSTGAYVFGARKLQLGEFLDFRRNLRFHCGLCGLDEMRSFGANFFWGSGVGFCWGLCGRLRIPDFVGVDLRLAQAGEVVGDGVFRIQAKMLGVSADESLVEYAAGKLIEVFFFDGLQHARADLGDVGNVIVREFFFLACLAEFVAEFSHLSSLCVPTWKHHRTSREGLPLPRVLDAGNHPVPFRMISACFRYQDDIRVFFAGLR